MKNKKDIKYLNKDFSSFRENLVNFAKTYFSDTINSFDESDPAMMFIELSSYVGDVLSYYLDSNLKESLLLQASERKNVVELSQALGYKPRPSIPSKTKLDIFQIIPATGNGANVKPDYTYALHIKENMRVRGQGTDFICDEKVNFAFSSSYEPTTVSIYEVDSDGVPVYYLLKKQKAISAGSQRTMEVTINDPEKYKKILINEPNVISIDKVMDADGNEWNEVPYLAQDTIFISEVNNNPTNQNLIQYANEIPYLLRTKKVPRRFITRYRADDTLELQFGAGTANDYDEEIVPNPDNVGLMTPTGVSKLNYSWDIANFMFTDAYGQAPSNTTLTITYSIGGGISSNVQGGVINNFTSLAYDDTSGLDTGIVSIVKNSLACNNPNPATGGRNQESIEDIRQNALANFAAQGRTVTRDDYILRALSMPPTFGAMAKAYIIQDEQLNIYDQRKKIRNPLTLNLYVLSYNADKQLVTANQALKENLSIYLDKYRMLTDSINIKNAYIINIGIKFVITVLPDYNSKEVLLTCINSLKEKFDIDNIQINQPIVQTDIIKNIANVDGVQSVIDVSVINLFNSDSGYVNNVYDIATATKDNIIYPSLDPSIFEIRFPDRDIVGKVVSY